MSETQKLGKLCEPDAKRSTQYAHEICADNPIMKFKLDTPLGIAKIFLLRYPICQVATEDDMKALSDLIWVIWDSALRAALVKAKEVYRETNPGGCKIYSKTITGEDCACFLCQMDDLIAATAGGVHSSALTDGSGKENRD